MQRIAKCDGIENITLDKELNTFIYTERLSTSSYSCREVINIVLF